MKTPNNLLEQLRAKIKACVDADALDYDGDEGPAARAKQNAGIELDDFVMVNGLELVEALTPSSAGTATSKLADELADLDRVASPAPWRSLRDGNQYIKTRYMPTAECVGASRMEGLPRPWNPHRYVSFGFRAEEHEMPRFLDNDGDLIQALRNNLPEIVAALRAQSATLALTDDEITAAWNGAHATHPKAGAPDLYLHYMRAVAKAQLDKLRAAA